MPPLSIFPPKAFITVCKIEGCKTRVIKYFHNVKPKIPHSLRMNSCKTVVAVPMLLPRKREKHRQTSFHKNHFLHIRVFLLLAFDGSNGNLIEIHTRGHDLAIPVPTIPDHRMVTG